MRPLLDIAATLFSNLIYGQVSADVILSIATVFYRLRRLLYQKWMIIRAAGN
jgi:hypothetical protein